MTNFNTSIVPPAKPLGHSSSRTTSAHLRHGIPQPCDVARIASVRLRR